MKFIYLLLFVCLFFFFKQKTAYELRISDWSSDVCSSDLSRSPTRRRGRREPPRRAGWCRGRRRSPHAPRRQRDIRPFPSHSRGCRSAPRDTRARAASRPLHGRGRRPRNSCQCRRSEEHTSELQSLMRISYAVFCLKNKNHILVILYEHL